MRRRALVRGSLAAGLLLALLGGVAPAGGAGSAFRVDKLILTTFDGEQEPFLRHHRWDRTFPAAGGEFAPIHCRTADHVCVTMTGTTKSKSGPSTMALLRDPRLQLDRRSLFIVAGIAGIRSQVGTLGSAGLADWSCGPPLTSRTNGPGPAPEPCMTCSAPPPASPATTSPEKRLPRRVAARPHALT